MTSLSSSSSSTPNDPPLGFETTPHPDTGDTFTRQTDNHTAATPEKPTRQQKNKAGMEFWSNLPNLDRVRILGNRFSDKITQFALDLVNRLSLVTAVIDEAITSDSLKDRIWAVEQILKRVRTEQFPGPSDLQELAVPPATAEPLLDPHQIEAMSDKDIARKIQTYLDDPGKPKK